MGVLVFRAYRVGFRFVRRKLYFQDFGILVVRLLRVAFRVQDL